MLAVDDRALLSGSEPEIRPGVQCVGAPELTERLHVAVLLHPRGALGGRTRGSEPPPEPAAFEFVRGADLGHVAQILEFAMEYGLTVVETSVSRRRVLLSGPVSAINDAFGTTVAVYEYPGGKYRARTGALHVAASVAPIIQSVTGI